MDELDIAAQEIERHTERSLSNALNAAERKKIEEKKRLSSLKACKSRNDCLYCAEPLGWFDQYGENGQYDTPFCDHECKAEYEREQEAMRNGRVRKVDA